MMIPEVGLELAYGTLGSVYSTTEGLIEKVLFFSLIFIL